MTARTPQPTPERIRTLARGDLVFEVLDEGPLDAEVVLLLHGFPQLNTSWSEVAPRLHAAGFRTLAPNQRGYSPGARPPGRTAYRMSELVDDVVALANEAGGRVHLVGHDWGAAVAWAVAMKHPELVRTLTAVSVPHPGAFLKAMPRGQALRSWYMALFNVPRFPEWLLSDRGRARNMLGRSGMTGAVFERFWREFGADAGALRGGLAWYRALPLNNLRAFGSPVRVPTTYVWSDHDTALGRAGAELCGQYVDAPYRLEVLAGASHWIPDEQPARLAEIVLERIRGTQ